MTALLLAADITRLLAGARAKLDECDRYDCAGVGHCDLAPILRAELDAAEKVVAEWPQRVETWEKCGVTPGMIEARQEATMWCAEATIRRIAAALGVV